MSKNIILTTAKYSDNVTYIKEFTDWILNIRDVDMNLNENVESIVKIPKDILIENTESSLLSWLNLCILNLW